MARLKPMRIFNIPGFPAAVPQVMGLFKRCVWGVREHVVMRYGRPAWVEERGRPLLIVGRAYPKKTPTTEAGFRAVRAAEAKRARRRARNQGPVTWELVA